MQKSILPAASQTSSVCLKRMTNGELLREIFRVTAAPTAVELELAQRLEQALSQLNDTKE